MRVDFESFEFEDSHDVFDSVKAIYNNDPYDKKNHNVQEVLTQPFENKHEY